MIKSIPPIAITCLGAYQDSGIGTGGFLLIESNKKIHVIDKFDSTGLYLCENNLYRYVRALNHLAIYSKKNGFVGTLKLPKSNDIHDIRVIDDQIIAVSTGNNQIHWYDLKANCLKIYQERGKGDATHINCIYPVDNSYLVSLFGYFNNHREWVGKARGKGIVKDLISKNVIFDGLSGPHNPYADEKYWYVCNSWEQTLIRKSKRNQQQDKLNLKGFTRGLAMNEKYIFVGVNADRKSETSKNGHLAIINKNSFKVIDTLDIPFPELYDVVILEEGWMEHFKKDPDKFELPQKTDNIRSIQNQVEIGENKIIELNQKIDKLKMRNKIIAKFKNMLFKH